MPQPKKVDIRSTIIRQRMTKHRDQLMNDLENEEKNVAQVLAWIDTAQELGDIELKIDLIVSLGSFHKSRGANDKALEAYQTAEQLSQQSGAPLADLISIKYNIATIQIDGFRRYQEGIDQYQQAILLSEDIPDEEALRIKLHCHSNLSLAYLLSYQYDNARSAIESFWEEWESPYLNTIPPDRRGSGVTVIRRVEAMVHIIKGEYEQADNKIRLLLELTKPQNKHSYTVTGYLLQVMLALGSPNHPTNAEDYWKQAEKFVDELLEQQDAAIYYIAHHSYGENADQFAYLGHNDWAERCREMAKQLYSKSGQVDISL